MHVKALIVKLFFTQPIRTTSIYLDEFIEKDDFVLDLGMGSGIVASEFSKKFSVKMQGADIGDFRSPTVTIPLTIFDGKTLPFPDNYFDHVLLSFTLHHSEDPRELLLEARRVAKKYIFIYEDILNYNFLRKIAWYVHASFYSFIFGSKEGGYISEKNWLNIFSLLNLRVLKRQRIKWFHPLNLIPKVLFVLEVNEKPLGVGK